MSQEHFFINNLNRIRGFLDSYYQYVLIQMRTQNEAIGIKQYFLHFILSYTFDDFTDKLRVVGGREDRAFVAGQLLYILQNRNYSGIWEISIVNKLLNNEI